MLTTKDYEAMCVNAAIQGKAMPALKEVVLDTLKTEKSARREILIDQVSRQTMIDKADLAANISNILRQLEKEHKIFSTSFGVWQVF